MLTRLARTTVACATVGLLASCADMASNIGSTLHTNRIDSALQNNQAVWITRDIPFNYLKNLASIQATGGDYRPAVTYWRNQQTGHFVVIGGDDETGFYKLTNQTGLAPQYDYRIVEPGRYELMGFAFKTTTIKNLYALPLSNKRVSSPWGLLRFSQTELPELHAVTGYVPPKFAGQTMDAGLITNWYTPGHTEEFNKQGTGDAVFVDGRGLISHVGKDIATLGVFELKPGEMAVLNDFVFTYDIGACNATTKGQWDCAPSGLRLSVDFAHSAPDVQKAMHDQNYGEDLIAKVTEEALTPGLFFAGQDMGVPDQEHTHAFLGSVATYRVFKARTPQEIAAFLNGSGKQPARKRPVAKKNH